MWDWAWTKAAPFWSPLQDWEESTSSMAPSSLLSSEGRGRYTGFWISPGSWLRGLPGCSCLFIHLLFLGKENFEEEKKKFMIVFQNQGGCKNERNWTLIGGNSVLRSFQLFNVILRSRIEAIGLELQRDGFLFNITWRKYWEVKLAAPILPSILPRLTRPFQRQRSKGVVEL